MSEAHTDILKQAALQPPRRIDRRAPAGHYQVWLSRVGESHPYISDYPSIQVAMRRSKEVAKLGGVSHVALYDDLGNFFKTVKKASRQAAQEQTSNAVDGAAARFRDHMDLKINEHYRLAHPAVVPPILSLIQGNDFIRVVKADGGLHREAVAFVARSTGNVYLAETWDRPRPMVIANVLQSDTWRTTRLAFDQYNVPELLGQLKKVLLSKGLEDTWDELTKCQAPRKINDAWMSLSKKERKKAKAWSPESRLLAALGNVAGAVSHMGQLAREYPPAKQNALEALKHLERGEQIMGRDIARDMSLPGYRAANLCARLAQLHAMRLASSGEDFINPKTKGLAKRALGKLKGLKTPYSQKVDLASNVGGFILAIFRVMGNRGATVELNRLFGNNLAVGTGLGLDRELDTLARNFVNLNDGEVVAIGMLLLRSVRQRNAAESFDSWAQSRLSLDQLDPASDTAAPLSPSKVFDSEVKEALGHAGGLLHQLGTDLVEIFCYRLAVNINWSGLIRTGVLGDGRVEGATEADSNLVVDLVNATGSRIGYGAAMTATLIAALLIRAKKRKSAVVIKRYALKAIPDSFEAIG